MCVFSLEGATGSWVGQRQEAGKQRRREERTKEKGSKKEKQERTTAQKVEQRPEQNGKQRWKQQKLQLYHISVLFYRHGHDAAPKLGLGCWMWWATTIWLRPSFVVCATCLQVTRCPHHRDQEVPGTNAAGPVESGRVHDMESMRIWIHLKHVFAWVSCVSVLLWQVWQVPPECPCFSWFSLSSHFLRCFPWLLVCIASACLFELARFGRNIARCTCKSGWIQEMSVQARVFVSHWYLGILWRAVKAVKAVKGEGRGVDLFRQGVNACKCVTCTCAWSEHLSMEVAPSAQVGPCMLSTRWRGAPLRGGVHGDLLPAYHGRHNFPDKLLRSYSMLLLLTFFILLFMSFLSSTLWKLICMAYYF